MSLAAMLCASLLFSCSPDLEPLPQPNECKYNVEAEITKVKSHIYDTCQEIFSGDAEIKDCVKKATDYASSPPTEEGKEIEEGRSLYILNKHLLECDIK